MGHGQQGVQQTACRMSLSGIKHLDPHASQIIDGSDHVDVYSYNEETKEWFRTFQKASLLIYSRNAEPSYVLLVDYFFDVQLTPQKKVKVQAPVMFYKNELNRARCFRFENKDECDRIGALVKRIIELKPLEQPKNQVGILSMLAKAQEDFNKTITNDNAAQPNQQLKPIPSIKVASPGSLSSKLLDLQQPKQPAGLLSILAKAQEELDKTTISDRHAAQPNQKFESISSTTSSTGSSSSWKPSSHLNQQPKNEVGLLSILAKTQEEIDKTTTTREHQQNHHLKPIPSAESTESKSLNVSDFFAVAKPTMASDNPNFKKVLSSMVSQTVSVDQIEKQQRKTVLHYTTPQLNFPAIKRIRSSESFSKCSTEPPHSKPYGKRQSLPRLDMGESTFTNFCNMFGSSDQNANNQNANDAQATEGPKLLTPTMLATTEKSTKNAGTSTIQLLAEHSSIDGVSKGMSKSEPLNSNQLLQAVTYLMKTDNDFVKKLHEAYLQSFKEMLA